MRRTETVKEYGMPNQEESKDGVPRKERPTPDVGSDRQPGLLSPGGIPPDHGKK
jgi:hypothetical protein